jgi:hypothetical protein
LTVPESPHSIGGASHPRPAEATTGKELSILDPVVVDQPPPASGLSTTRR